MKTRASPPKSIMSDEYLVRLTEVLAGLCVACILTWAFIGPLHLAGKLSVCGFSLALPLLVATRLEAWYRSFGRTVYGKWHDYIGLTGFVFAAGGFIQLLQEVLPWAGYCFLFSVIVLGLLCLFNCGPYSPAPQMPILTDPQPKVGPVGENMETSARAATQDSPAVMRTNIPGA